MACCDGLLILFPRKGSKGILQISEFSAKRPDNRPFVPTKVREVRLHCDHRKTRRPQEFRHRCYGVLVYVFMNRQTNLIVPIRQPAHRVLR